MKRRGLIDRSIDTIDWMSELPDHILHRVLSFLPTEEAARTSVLSKSWQRAWSTRSILNFDETFFGAELNADEDYQKKSLNFVDESLIRYRECKLRIQKLRLQIPNLDWNLAFHIDRWIGIAVENGLEELDICIETPSVYYRMPQTVLASKSITVLSLKSCVLEQPLPGNSRRLCSLQKLYLFDVRLDEQIIQTLISTCPLIESIDLIFCLGLNKYQISGLHKLKEISIFLFKESGFEMVDIDVPSLEKFVYVATGANVPCTVNVAATPNMKKLHLSCDRITDESFQELISKFPNLESLSIGCCHMLERIKISSPRLKRFALVHCDKLVEVKIDASNLESCYYSGNPEPVLSSSAAAGDRWIAKRIHLEWRNLGGLLVPPVHEVEKVELDVQSLSSYSAFVDGLLWSCHPRFLHVQSQCNNEFIEFLRETLMDREHPQCCSSEHIKCWRHYLKDVKIESFGGIEDEKPIHSQTSFRLKWRSH
ncbi:hypothetical protein F0562_034778 [Nyssa sinensis]|uniref:F-box domain-containing protein n=1 Tax=Nyssa sinensis TaxID=561372 RepID=A0A5J5ADE0_9ASTE|nr:hypothetical protein F0562_034778 [Nyssa sinensis]